MLNVHVLDRPAVILKQPPFFQRGDGGYRCMLTLSTHNVIQLYSLSYFSLLS